MENSTLDEKTVETKGLVLNEEGIKFLKEGRGWALFMAILGFIGMAFMLIGAIAMFVMGSFIGSQTGFPGALMGLLYLVIGAAYSLPVIYLAKFSNKAGQACDFSDQEAFNQAIKDLRSHFKSAGIAIISIIALYFIVFIVAIVGGINSFM
ncbi:MAG: hypothetical protein JXR61_05515 [Prolixibacteraceae bacterium]|nr:hypothetical protein [Prolixibacteraceae bacterium]